MEILILIGFGIVFAWLFGLNYRINLEVRNFNVAVSAIWNSLIENGIVSEEMYQRAMKNAKYELRTEKQKKAQIEALRDLLNSKDGTASEGRDS